MFRSGPASSPKGPDVQEQPVTESSHRVGFVFWLAWVMANAVGFGALWMTDWATGGPVSRAGNPFSAVFDTRAWLIIGTTVGVMQALVLRERFSRSVLWVLATTAGMPAALWLSVVTTPMLDFIFGALGFRALGLEPGPFVIGAVIGIVQGFVLRGRLPRPILWMLGNSVAYATAFDAGFIAGARANSQTYLMVGYTVGGAMVGAVTGVVLVWQSRLSHRLLLERPKLAIMLSMATRSMIDALALLRCWPILSVSFLAWILSEGVILPLTRVEAPNAKATALIVLGLVVLLAIASFVVDTAAAFVAPASVVSRGHLPTLMFALAAVVLALGIPIQLVNYTRFCMSDSVIPGAICRSLAPLQLPLALVAPLVLSAVVYLILRLALVPPAVALGGASVNRAFRVSWRLTKEQSGRLLLLGSPPLVLWSGVALLPVSWPMPWLGIARVVIGGVASAWLAIALTLAYIQLDGAIQPGQPGSARSFHKTVILGMLIFAVVGAGLDVGWHGLIPSGSGRIAFASERQGATQIYVMNPDGSNVVRLTSPPRVARSPRFSPDGRRIAFFSYGGGRTQIAMMNADGSGETRLTDLPGPGEDLEFIMGGSKIAFVVHSKGIFLMNTDGSNVTRLADLPPDAWWDSHTSHVSSDGRKIVFMSSEITHPPGQPPQDISLMNADGTNVVRLIKNGAEPAFSPDGGKIVFVSVDDHQIYVMNADGSNVIRLASPRGDSKHPRLQPSDPAFSPDGRKIVFLSGMFGHRQIYLMHADGSNVTWLTARWDNTDPTVSP